MKRSTPFRFASSPIAASNPTVSAAPGGGASLTIYPDNKGTLINQGTMKATAGTLVLDTDFTTANIGTLQAAGGEVRLTRLLDNTGSTLTLTPATGSWTVMEGTIRGGVVTEIGGAKLLFEYGTLDGVTLNGDLDLTGYGTEVK